MTAINTATNSQSFGWPYQKRATAKKNDQFCKDCLEAAEKMIPDKLSYKDKQEVIVNERIVNGKLDRQTIEKELNPYTMKGLDNKADHIVSFPLLKDKVDLIIGEEWKRKFDYQVVVVNPDAINSKMEKIKKNIYNFLTKKAMEQTSDRDELKREIQKYQKYMKYTYRDLNEIRSNRILNKLWRDLELKRKFNKGMKDLIIKRSEIFCTDIVAGKPDVRRVKPENVKLIGMGESDDVSDADKIIEESYESPGWIIDHYYDWLSDTQKATIDRGLTENSSASGGGTSLNYTDPDHGYPQMGWNSDMTELIDTSQAGGANYGGPKDEFGNIRVTRMVWKSLRKLGEVEWVDEFGEKQKKIVDENYKPRKGIGEQVNWEWVNEFWETTRIGKDIYVKMQPRPIQFRRRGNISLGGSGYTGIIRDTSLVDLMKPFQVMYDIFMDRTKDAFMKAKGMLMTMDISRKPRGWSVDKWLNYMQKLNIIFEDPFNEGDAGAAKGKIAGNMQQSGRGAIDLTLGNYIQQHILMLQYIEQRIGDIAGIPRAREGQSSPTETATGVQNAVAQSYHITEPYFADHEFVKEKTLETLLETAKHCYRDSPELVQFYTSEAGNVIDEIGGEEFSLTDYGLDVTTSANDNQLLQEYRQLAHAAIQNDKMNLSTMGAIYSSPSMTKIRRDIEEAEEQAEERQEMAVKREMKMKQEENQKEQMNKDKDREVDVTKNREDNKTKIITELIKEQSNDKDRAVEQDKINRDERLNMEKILQEYSKLEEEVLKSDKELGVKGEDLKMKAQEIRERRQEKQKSAA